MHPLTKILTAWAGLSQPHFDAHPVVELREMQSPKGRLVFFFNHSDQSASVQFHRDLEKPASGIQEIMTAEKITTTGATLTLKTEVPAQSVRIYRIDF